MAEVARVRTATTPEQVAEVLTLVLLSFTDSATREQASLLLAQLMLEVANGAACYNWNVGNITSDETGTFYRPVWFTVNEDSSARMKELHEAMLRGQAPRAFRAYSALEGGIYDYLRVLQHNFRSLWDASLTGDPNEFGSAIKTSRYTPDAPRGTIESIAKLQSQYLQKGLFAKLPPLDGTEPNLPAVPAS